MTGKTLEIKKKTDNRLREICEGLSHRKRVVLVIAALILFAVTAVYMAVSSICFEQKHELNIKHIEGLKLNYDSDSINILKIRNYDNKH